MPKFIKIFDLCMLNGTKIIQSLDLRNNSIQVIPEEMFQITQLQKLQLDYNYISTLPNSSNTSESLTYLSMQSNQLCSLPKNFAHSLPSLVNLILNDNHLKVLPQDLGNLTQLELLHLHNNPIKKLPLSMRKLNKLNEFGLDWIIYHDPDYQGKQKILKDTLGQATIREFLTFLRVFSSVQRQRHSHYVRFTHFIMHSHMVSNLEDIYCQRFRPRYRTILHLLANFGHTHLLQDLIKALVPAGTLNSTDDDRNTPLILGIKNRNSEFAIFLLKKFPQINVNLASPKHSSPLLLALHMGEFQVANQLLKNPSIDVHLIRQNDGFNAIHEACVQYHKNEKVIGKILKQLVHKGANINKLSKNGMS